jgi:hypothetical protein
MIEIGDMVRAGGPPMKLIAVRHGIAECLLIDHEGRVRLRFHHIDHLSPMRLALQPRSLWAEVRQLDLIEIEEEERKAKAERRARRKAATKAKRSNKIKRGVTVST